jgi:hypothetical protein
MVQIYVQHSNRGPRNVFSRAAAPREPPKSLFEDFTDAVVTGQKQGYFAVFRYVLQ